MDTGRLQRKPSTERCRIAGTFDAVVTSGNVIGQTESSSRNDTICLRYHCAVQAGESGDAKISSARRGAARDTGSQCSRRSHRNRASRDRASGNRASRDRASYNPRADESTSRRGDFIDVVAGECGASRLCAKLRDVSRRNAARSQRSVDRSQCNVTYGRRILHVYVGKNAVNCTGEFVVDTVRQLDGIHTRTERLRGQWDVAYGNGSVEFKRPATGSVTILRLTPVAKKGVPIPTAPKADQTRIRDERRAPAR